MVRRCSSVGVALGVAVAAAVAALAVAQCGEQPPVWRNRRLACPGHAVCGDVFTADRDWGNGTSCASVTTHYQCMCPGNTVCPIGNPAHMLYTTPTHITYTCQPACTFPACRRGDVALVKVHPQNGFFENQMFYRLQCRCKDHHGGMTRTGQRATKFLRERWDFVSRELRTNYKCKSEGAFADPCA